MAGVYNFRICVAMVGNMARLWDHLGGQILPCWCHVPWYREVPRCSAGGQVGIDFFGEIFRS